MKTDFIRVTYRIESAKPLDIEKKAQGIALGQTTDTWTPNVRSGLAALERHRGVVLATEAKGRGLAGVPDESPLASHIYHITIGYPPANTEGDIPSLLTMIFGKISMDGKIRLESIAFPSSYTKGKGPRFGIEGLRKKLKEPKRPLSMAIFKPCVGLSPNELSEMFYELACGGLSFVKDDEILPNLSICPTEKRLAACLKAGLRAKKETGHHTLYAVNLTGRPSELLPRAKRLAQQGAECFLLNVLSYGFGVLEELRSVGVPIMAHPALAGAWCGSSNTGFSYAVLLGTLMRLGGADLVLFPSSYGTVTLSSADTDAIRDELTSRLPMKRSFPVPSAGIHPGLVPRIVKDYGNDVVINAGGGVHGHPQGARAGAKAVTQAIDAVCAKRDFSSIPVSEMPELTQALQLWGRG